MKQLSGSGKIQKQINLCKSTEYNAFEQGIIFTRAQCKTVAGLLQQVRNESPRQSRHIQMMLLDLPIASDGVPR